MQRILNGNIGRSTGCFIIAAAVASSLSFATHTSALMLNPSLDYRLESGARQGDDLRDSDIKDAQFSGFGTFSESVMASVPGATTAAMQNVVVAPTSLSGTLHAEFAAGAGDGGATSRFTFDTRFDQQVELTLSGSGTATPPGQPSVSVLQRFANIILLNVRGAEINLDSALTEPLRLDPGFYRFNLSVSSGTQRHGTTLLHTSGQGDLNFTLNFAAVEILFGDADNNLSVSGSDLLAVTNNFGNTGPADGLLLGDADDNGSVSGSDLLAVTNNFGATLSGSLASSSAGNSAPVPEPATALLLLLIIICSSTIVKSRQLTVRT